eukprot:9638325-Alexandrium_andersonii.AAC.1
MTRTIRPGFSPAGPWARAASAAAQNGTPFLARAISVGAPPPPHGLPRHLAPRGRPCAVPARDRMFCAE